MTKTITLKATPNNQNGEVRIELEIDEGDGQGPSSYDGDLCVAILPDVSGATELMSSLRPESFRELQAIASQAPARGAAQVVVDRITNGSAIHLPGRGKYIIYTYYCDEWTKPPLCVKVDAEKNGVTQTHKVASRSIVFSLGENERDSTVIPTTRVVELGETVRWESVAPFALHFQERSPFSEPHLRSRYTGARGEGLPGIGEMVRGGAGNHFLEATVRMDAEIGVHRYSVSFCYLNRDDVPAVFTHPSGEVETCRPFRSCD